MRSRERVGIEANSETHLSRLLLDNQFVDSSMWGAAQDFDLELKAHPIEDGYMSYIAS